MRGQTQRITTHDQARFASAAALLSTLFAFGCQSLDSSPPIAGGPIPGISASVPGIDERPVALTETAPPPISGGTLLALSDGRRAIVSDPDRDRVLVVDYVSGNFEAIQLEARAEPGRIAEDQAGHAFVVLRGTGELLTLDLPQQGNAATLGERRKVCAMPRGVAVDPSSEKLVVACAEGKLIELPAVGGSSFVETTAPIDVRDIVFSGKRSFVTRFRAAELLELDAARAVAGVRSPGLVTNILREPAFVPELAVGGQASATFEPEIAWRAVAGPGGGVVMVHQRATSEGIDIQHPSGETSVPSDGSSAYGGGTTGCGGIVQSSVTMIDGNGTLITSPQLAGVVLPVDVAVSFASKNSGLVAIAAAGAIDLNTPVFRGVISSSVTLLTANDIDRGKNGTLCMPVNGSFFLGEPAVAVAFDPVKGRLLVQTREPAQLVIMDDTNTRTLRAIPLGGRPMLHTGHEIFHRDSGAGLACASCHAEGTEDGRTWNFVPLGPRRTQPMDVGLGGTQPFHWDGSLPNLSALMSEVFVGRMGGPRESAPRIAALESWMFDLRPRASVRPASDEAALRGKALFQSSSVNCVSCHAGEKFTSQASADVGTGGKFQVPSLLGVAHRLPVMHDGCAKTLRDRFSPACGGNAHGNTSHLSEAEVQDLVAFLESI
jgi:mono/diheme cytochrome c family protein